MKLNALNTMGAAAQVQRRRTIMVLRRPPRPTGTIQWVRMDRAVVLMGALTCTRVRGRHRRGLRLPMRLLLSSKNHLRPTTRTRLHSQAMGPRPSTPNSQILRIPLRLPMDLHALTVRLPHTKNPSITRICPYSNLNSVTSTTRAL